MFNDTKEGQTHSFPPRGKVMTDEIYGRLTVTCDWLPPKKKGQTYQWLCNCKCGKQIYATRDHLKSGNVKSCGCLFKEVHSEMAKNRVGEKNHSWTGEDVSYAGVHLWIHRHKPKTEFCQKCGLKSRLDAANISGKYKRDINDFEWLCRKCHMLGDGRLDQLIKRNKKNGH